MSLEQLRAQAEAEDKKATEAEEPEAEVEEPEQPEEPEAEQEETEEPEAEEAEESEDFELELDGEPEPGQQKPTREEALVHRLTAKHHKYKEARDERDALAERVKELEAKLNGNTQQPQSQPQQTRHEYPPVPLLYENGIDTPEQYQKAYQKWVADCKAIDQRHAEANQQQSEHKRQMEEMTRNLAKRVGKFASEHKIKDDRVIGAIEKATSEVDEATKIDGSLAYLLDSVGDGGERVAYYIGTNDAAMSKVKELLQADKSGLKAIAHMTRLAEKLKPRQAKRTSKAPEPDQPLRGDGSSASAKALQDKWDKAKDPQEMIRLRKKARELGVKLT